jgi:hypothetical protein
MLKLLENIFTVEMIAIIEIFSMILEIMLKAWMPLA